MSSPVAPVTSPTNLTGGDALSDSTSSSGGVTVNSSSGGSLFFWAAFAFSVVGVAWILKKKK